MKKYIIYTLVFVVYLSKTTDAQVAAEISGADRTDEQLAVQYFRDGQFDKAVLLYEELFEKRPTQVVYNNYLVCLLELEEYRKAERLVRGQIRQYPEQVRYEVDLGWVLERSGNTRQSRRQFDNLINTLPASLQPVIDLSVAFEQRQMTDRAIDAYLQGRKLMGSSVPLHMRLAPLYERKGDFHAMMNEYISYMEQYPVEIDMIRGILQDAISHDPNYMRNEALRNILLSRSQSFPDRSIYAEMLLWLSIQQKDFRMALSTGKAYRQGEICSS